MMALSSSCAALLVLALMQLLPQVWSVPQLLMH